MATLSAGITASLPKGGDVKRQQRTRDLAHQAGGTIPEWWAAIDRNGGRLQFGMMGDIISVVVGAFARNHQPGTFSRGSRAITSGSKDP
ncbi:MAG: hypothetical protein ACJ8BE_19710, partial [Microvirga sp.]